MPRKPQFTGEDVVAAAFELVREKGLTSLSAPAVAEKMGCSTMPIYSHFTSMQALEDEVVKKIWEMVSHYQTKEYTGDAWIDQAMGYILFARDEKNLFKAILNSRNKELKYQMNRLHWDKLARALDDYPAFEGLDLERIMRIRYTRAMLSHGIATAAKIGMNKIFFESDRLLARFLADASQALLEGFKEVPPLEGEERRLMQKKIKEKLYSEN